MQTKALQSYSELLVRTVTNLIYLDPPNIRRRPLPPHRLHRRIAGETEDEFHSRFNTRENGRDWPSCAHSMAGYKRLRSLADLVLDVIAKDVPGDFIETGVWRGGACILMHGISTASGNSERKTYVADSFEGLPPPNAAEFPADEGDSHHTCSEVLGVSLEQVQKNFASYGLLDDNVVFLKGWFKDTLPSLGKEKFSIIRLDGDMYESTIQAFEHLYPKLSVGGYVVVDDYGAVKGCKKAVSDFRERLGITSPVKQVDWTGIYWKKEAELDDANAA